MNPELKTQFEPDFSDDRFEIIIIGKKNGISTSIKFLNGHNPTYFDVVGVLEYAKLCQMEKQWEYNKSVLAEKNKEPKVQVSDTTKPNQGIEP